MFYDRGEHGCFGRLWEGLSSQTGWGEGMSQGGFPRRGDTYTKSQLILILILTIAKVQSGWSRVGGGVGRGRVRGH